MTDDIPAEWFPAWPHPGYALGRRLQAEPDPWAMFLRNSADEDCTHCGGQNTLRFLGYLWGCVSGSGCGHWWQAWRCTQCGAEETDGY